MKKLILFLCGIALVGSSAFAQVNIIEITGNVNGVSLAFGEKICVGEQVTFREFTTLSADEQPRRSIDWEFDGGFPATSKDDEPTVTYNTPGIYDVTLTVTGQKTSTTFTAKAMITVVDYAQDAVIEVSEDFEYFAFPPKDWRVEGPWKLGTRGIDRDTIYDPALVPTSGVLLFTTMADNIKDTIVWKSSNRSAVCQIYEGEAVDPQWGRRIFETFTGDQSLYPPALDTRDMTGGLMVKADVAYRATVDYQNTRLYGSFEMGYRDACSPGTPFTAIGRWDIATLPALATSGDGAMNPASTDSIFEPKFVPSEEIIEWQHLQAALLDVRSFDFVEFQLKFNSFGGNNFWVDNVLIGEITCPFGAAIMRDPSLEIWPYMPPFTGPFWNCSAEPAVTFQNFTAVPGDVNTAKYTWIYDAVVDSAEFRRSGNTMWMPNPGNPWGVEDITSFDRNGEATYWEPAAVPHLIVRGGYPRDTIIDGISVSAGDTLVYLPPNNETRIYTVGDTIWRRGRIYDVLMIVEDAACGSSDSVFEVARITPWNSCLGSICEDFDNGISFGNIDEYDNWVHRAIGGGFAWPIPMQPIGWFPSDSYVASCFTGVEKFPRSNDGSVTKCVVAANIAPSICFPYPTVDETWLITPKIDLSRTEAKHYIVEFDMAFAPDYGRQPFPNVGMEIAVMKSCIPNDEEIIYRKATYDTAGASLHTRDPYQTKEFPWYIPGPVEWITERAAIQNFQTQYIDQEDSVIRFKFINKGTANTGSMLWIDNVCTKPWNHDAIAEFRSNRREQCVGAPIRLHSSSYPLGGAIIVGYDWDITAGTGGSGFPGIGVATYDPDSTSDQTYATLDEVGTYDVTLHVFTDLGGEADTVSVTYKDYISIVELVAEVYEIDENFEDGLVAPLDWGLLGTGWTPSGLLSGGYGCSNLSAESPNTNAGVATSLISPIIESSKYPQHMEITFDWAHRRDGIPRNPDDELSVSISTCDGEQEIWSLTGNNINQSGSPNIAGGFTPQGKDWRTKRLYVEDISEIGNVSVLFNHFQSGNNSIFLDNIRVRPVCDVVAEFRPVSSDVVNKIYGGILDCHRPILGCQFTPIGMKSTSKIIDQNNDNPTYQWIFEGEPTVQIDPEDVTPDFSDVLVMWDKAGKYDVTLIVTSSLPGGCSDTITMENYVHIQPLITGEPAITDDFEGNGTSDLSGFTYRDWGVIDRGWYSTLEEGVPHEGVSNEGELGTSNGSAAINHFTNNFEGESLLLKSRTVGTEEADFLMLDFDWAYGYDTDCNNCTPDLLNISYTSNCGNVEEGDLEYVADLNLPDIVTKETSAEFEPERGDWKNTLLNGDSIYVDVRGIPAINLVFESVPGNPGGANNTGVNVFYLDNIRVKPVNGVVSAFILKEEKNCHDDPNFVQFFDRSYVPAARFSSNERIISWEWSFDGAADGFTTSTEQNPAILYDTPGWKDVTLTVTTQNYTDTKVYERAVFIESFVSDEFAIKQEFETDMEDFLKYSGWKIRPEAAIGTTDADGAPNTWYFTDPGGYRSSPSSLAMNCTNRNSLISDLVSPVMKVRHTDDDGEDQYMTNFKVNFDYAYTYKEIDGLRAVDELYLEFTTDCGYTWERVWESGGEQFATRSPLNEDVFAAAGQRNVFEDPKVGEWESQELEFLFYNRDRANDDRGIEGPESIQFRFRVSAQQGNQMFLDNVNIELFDFQEPKADFISELSPDDVIFKGATIRYYDLSEGIPFNWAWTFPGANDPISNAEEPEVRYLETGVYDVSLTVSNIVGTNALTKKQFMTVIPYDGSVDSLDNRPENYFTDLPDLQRNLSAADDDTYVGYFSGHNSENTIHVAEYFTDFHPYNELRTAAFGFGLARYADDANSKIKIKVWDAKGIDRVSGLPDGSPGLEVYPGTNPAYQGLEEVLISDLAAIVDTMNFQEVADNEAFYVHTFPAGINSVTVDREFYLGIELSYDPKDTVVLLTSPLQEPNLVNETSRRPTFSGWTSFPLSEETDNEFSLWDDYAARWENKLTIDGESLFNQSMGSSVRGLTNWIFPVLGANYSIVSGINDEGKVKEFEISVYPNPTDGMLNIFSPEAKVLGFALYDVLGKVVLQTESTEGIEQVDMQGLSSGIYILKISTDRGEVTKKISLEY